MKLLSCISITHIHTAEPYAWSSSQFHFIRNKLNGTITILHTAQLQNQRYSYDNAMKIWIKFYLAIIVRVCAYQHSNHTYKKTSAMKNYQRNNSNAHSCCYWCVAILWKSKTWKILSCLLFAKIARGAFLKSFKYNIYIW